MILKKFLPYLLLTPLALFFSAPHLVDPYWHDEIYTLLKFADTWRHALFDYHLPNNHQLFSLLLWGYQWFIPAEALNNYALLRCLPLAFFIGALWLLIKLARKYGGGGNFAAIICGLLFITSRIPLAQATQLRGYGISMFFALAAFYFLARYLENFCRRDLLFYLIICWILVGILPTNLLICAALAGWAISVVAVNQRQSAEPFRGVKKAKIYSLPLIAFAPFAGLIFLLVNYSQLPEAMKTGAAMARGEFLAHSLVAYFRDLIFFAPLFIAAALKAICEIGKRGEARQNTGSGALIADWFAILMFAVPAGICVLMSRPPNDRVLAVMSPLIYLGVGIVSARTIIKIFSTRGSRIFVIALLAAGLLLVAEHREKFPLAWRIANPDGFDYDNRVNVHNLYDQWYKQGDPTPRIGELSARLARAGAIVVFAADDDDAYAWFAYTLLHRVAGSDNGAVVWWEKLRTTPEMFSECQQLAKQLPVIIIALTRDGAFPVAAAFDLPPEKLRVIYQNKRFLFLTADKNWRFLTAIIGVSYE